MPSRRHPLVELITAQFSRYIGAGALGTAAHYLVLMLCVEGLGLPPWSGSAAGATAGALVNYVLNYHFIFAADQPHRQTLPKFLAVAAVGVGVNAVIVRLGTDVLGLHYLFAQLIGTGVNLVLGFSLNKLWTFRSSER